MTAMAEPTLRDVLDALANIRSDVASVRSEVASVRSEMATKVDLGAFRADVVKRFDDLDAELTKHADVHREIEKDVEGIKRRPARTAARPARRR